MVSVQQAGDNRLLLYLQSAVVLSSLALVSLGCAHCQLCSGGSREILTTQKIAIMGTNGKVVAVLGSREDGSKGLEVFDAQGTQRLFFGLDLNDAPRIELFDREGWKRLDITDGPSLSLLDPFDGGRGGRRILLEALEDGAATMQVFGSDMSTSAGLECGGPAGAIVGVWTDAGNAFVLPKGVIVEDANGSKPLDTRQKK